MIIQPRGTETKPVVELLESGEFDTPEKLAKAIIKAVYAEVMGRRDMWVLGQSLGGGVVVTYGPFTSESEAKKFIEKAELIGKFQLLPMHAPLSVLDEHDKRANEWKAIAAGTNALCANCGHPQPVHQHEGFGRRCGLSYRGKGRDKNIKAKCECRGFTEAEAA